MACTPFIVRPSANLKCAPDLVDGERGRARFSTLLGMDLVEETIALRDGELVVVRPRDAEALIDETAFEHEKLLPYWAEVWPSGVALTRRLSGRSLRGARVLELGCGLGLPSLAAARAGGRVTATDWAPDAIALLADNAARNDLAVEGVVAAWEDPQPLLERGPWDLVLAADVLYEARVLDPLLALLARLGAEVWLADPSRPLAPAFLERAAEAFAVASKSDADHPAVLHHTLRPVAGAAQG